MVVVSSVRNTYSLLELLNPS